EDLTPRRGCRRGGLLFSGTNPCDTQAEEFVIRRKSLPAVSEADGTRTRNHWIDSLSSQNPNIKPGNELRQAAGCGCTYGCTSFGETSAPTPGFTPSSAASDPALAYLIQAWPVLSPAARTAVLATVHALAESACDGAPENQSSNSTGGGP
ncbi:MAG: hypothetical protein KY475_14555, partial [Planctomycetes bacterium]|nr:hypothetical protein [Planctomycetota bacterium]